MKTNTNPEATARLVHGAQRAARATMVVLAVATLAGCEVRNPGLVQDASLSEPEAHGALIHGGTPMGDPALTRRSYVCHYTAAAGHKALARHRVGDGYDFTEPPSLPETMRPRSLPSRLVAAAGRRLKGLMAAGATHG